jgi:16S rRNA (cytosine967-C5)-methyltransferase
MPRPTGPPKTARFAAIETLLRLQRTRYPVKPLLDTVAAECHLIGTDRNMAMNLMYGVLRHREYLDLLLASLCKRPIGQIDPHVYQALCVGLYQLFFLDRIPESAAVNETVNAMKASGLKPHLHGFVNGVLRAAIRRRDELPAPGNSGPSGEPLLNHPAWLTSRWQARFGREEMQRICASNNLEPLLVLRVNTLRISSDDYLRQLGDAGIAAHPGRYGPDSLQLPEYRGSITALPGYDQGFFQVQDEAAQLAVLLLGPFTEPVAYLDGCAGLGGKTSHIMQSMAAGSRVVAVEPEPQRYRLLQENISRLCPDQPLSISRCSLQEYSRTSRLQFQRILIDAPCSGTGVIGRHPDIRWNRQPEDLSRYQQSQLELLDCAADLTAIDGILVYATCSLEPEENQQVIEQFLAEHRDFCRLDCGELLPEAARRLTEDGYFVPRPSSTIDGFFAARLQKYQ